MAQVPGGLAQSRFTHDVAGHWPVFAVLAARGGVVALLLRRRTPCSPEPPRFP